MADHNPSGSIQSSQEETDSPSPSPPPTPTFNRSVSSGSINVVGNQEQEQETNSEKSKKYSKLVLWNTRNFTPILSHDQLQPIMATLGFSPLSNLSAPPPAPPANPNPNPNSDSDSDYSFHHNYLKSTSSDSDSNSVPLPVPVTLPVLWKEYYYHPSAGQKNSESPPPPLPRLPYPNIVGLNIRTYGAFLQAINFYIPTFSNKSDIFHLRGIPLQEEDRNKLWHNMRMPEITNLINIHFAHCEPSFDDDDDSSAAAACKKSGTDDQSNSGSAAGNDVGGTTRGFGVFVPLDACLHKATSSSSSSSSSYT